MGGSRLSCSRVLYINVTSRYIGYALMLSQSRWRQTRRRRRRVSFRSGVFGRQMARPARRTWILYAARWQDDRSGAWPHQYVPVAVVIIVVIIIVIIIVVVVIVVAKDDEVSLSAIGIRRWVGYGRCVGAAFHGWLVWLEQTVGMIRVPQAVGVIRVPQTVGVIRVP